MVETAGAAEIPFLVNLSARRAGRWRQVVARLGAMGVAARPVLVDDPHAWAASVEAVVAERPPAVLLGGGDGSFSRGLGPFVGSGIAVGFIPLGTGNGIARTFGIDSLAGACRAVAEGHSVLAGAARANGHYFLNMASAGISVEVTRGVIRDLKQAAGLAAYPISIARAVLGRRPFRVRLSAAGETSRFSAVQVIVFNGRYVSRWPAPGAIEPGAGLDICALPPLALPRLALAVTAFWLGRRGRSEARDSRAPAGVMCRQAQSATIDTDPVLAVNVDGEILTQTPLQVEWLAEAVRVYVA